jgi:hypothetical protein
MLKIGLYAPSENKIGPSAVVLPGCGALRVIRENSVAERQPATQAATQLGIVTGEPREQPVETMRAQLSRRVWEEAVSHHEPNSLEKEKVHEKMLLRMRCGHPFQASLRP